MTVRQLTADEAHVFDHLVDALLGQGAQGVLPWLLKANEMGFSFPSIQRYTLQKVEKIRSKPVEEYDDGEEVIRPRPRLPFNADYDIVAEDREVLKEYLNHASLSRDTFYEQDIAPGTGDRLEMGMKMRRRKHER